MSTTVNHYLLDIEKASVYVTRIDFGGEDSTRRRYILATKFIDTIKSGDLVYSCGVFFSNFKLEECSQEFEIEGSTKKISISSSECVKLDSSIWNQFLNFLIKRIFCAFKGYESTFSGCFDMKNPNRSIKKLSIYSGFKLEVEKRLYNKVADFSLLINTKFKVLNRETVLQVIQSMNFEEIKRKIIGKSVVTIYNFRSYAITGINFKLSPASEIEPGMTYVKYYKDRGVLISNTQQPLLECARDKSLIHLIPEYCVLSEIVERREIPSKTSLNPADRYNKIDDAAGLFIGEPQVRDYLKKFGVRIVPKQITVKCKVLAPPDICFSTGMTLRVPPDFKQHITSLDYLNDERIGVDVYLIYKKDRDSVIKYWDSIRDELDRIGSPLIISGFKEIMRVNFSTALNELVFNRNKKNLVIAFVVSDADYVAVRSFCTFKGCQEQCIRWTPYDIRVKTGNRRGPIISNISRQILNKFGYYSWWMDVKKFPAIKNLLLIGIDVNHSKLVYTGKCFKQKRSIYVIVAQAYTQDGVKTYCEAIPVSAGKEIMSETIPERDGLIRQKVMPSDDMLSKFVQRSVRELYPGKKMKEITVVVFRDGVSQSRYRELYKSEVENIQRIVPNLSYVVVLRNTDTRFILDRAGVRSNVKCGSVFLDGLSGSSQEKGSFYLVPCNTNLSTNRPMNYVVLYNSSTYISIEDIQRLSWSLCHTYQNWPGSILVPDVCKYADKFAYVLGSCQYTESVVNEGLRTSLFYL